jgi:hypothetical protein
MLRMNTSTASFPVMLLGRQIMPLGSFDASNPNRNPCTNPEIVAEQYSWPYSLVQRSNKSFPVTVGADCAREGVTFNMATIATAISGLAARIIR